MLSVLKQEQKKSQTKKKKNAAIRLIWKKMFNFNGFLRKYLNYLVNFLDAYIAIYINQKENSFNYNILIILKNESTTGSSLYKFCKLQIHYVSLY